METKPKKRFFHFRFNPTGKTGDKKHCFIDPHGGVCVCYVEIGDKAAIAAAPCSIEDGYKISKGQSKAFGFAMKQIKNNDFIIDPIKDRSDIYKLAKKISVKITEDILKNKIRILSNKYQRLQKKMGSLHNDIVNLNEMSASLNKILRTKGNHAEIIDITPK